MNDSTDCIFCKIADGRLACHKIFEDDVCLAFLDIGPLAEGHTLLISKNHYRDLTEMPAEALARLAGNLPRLAEAVVQATGVSGFNILQNNGQVAGQVVPHLHFHVIPRKAGDSLGYRWNPGSYSAGRAEELCASISRAFAEVR
jgi:histidine triad (HIT) family protein